MNKDDIVLLPLPDYFEDFMDRSKEELRNYARAAIKADRQRRSEDTNASEAYDAIDSFLRNNLDDDDYALYSKSLDVIYESQQPAEQKKEGPKNPTSDDLFGEGFFRHHDNKVAEQNSRPSPFEIGRDVAKRGLGISDLWSAVGSDGDLDEAMKGYEDVIGSCGVSAQRIATPPQPAEPVKVPSSFPTGTKYSVEQHGNGYAIYQGRDNFHHGLNLAHLTECTPEFSKRIESALNAMNRPVKVPSRDDILMALTSCKHSIESEKVILHCDGKQKGNALSQAVDRVVALLSQYGHTDEPVKCDGNHAFPPCDDPKCWHGRVNVRHETVSEHIARDIREGRFPAKSDRQMVSVEPVKVPAIRLSSSDVANVLLDIGIDEREGAHNLLRYLKFADALLARYGHTAEPVKKHPDDEAVDGLAVAMKTKLAKKRSEGRGGWQTMSASELSTLLHEHVAKGDPLDVANIAMMLLQNGQRIEPVKVPSDAELDAVILSVQHNGRSSDDIRYVRDICRAILTRYGQGPMSLMLTRALGIYGAAFDQPGPRRAYTYEHKPANGPAWRLGEACMKASSSSAGDYIDRGLVLLKEMQALGFGVFEIERSPNAVPKFGEDS